MRGALLDQPVRPPEENARVGARGTSAMARKGQTHPPAEATARATTATPVQVTLLGHYPATTTGRQQPPLLPAVTTHIPERYVFHQPDGSGRRSQPRRQPRPGRHRPGNQPIHCQLVFHRFYCHGDVADSPQQRRLAHAAGAGVVPTERPGLPQPDRCLPGLQRRRECTEVIRRVVSRRLPFLQCTRERWPRNARPIALEQLRIKKELPGARLRSQITPQLVGSPE